MALKLFSPPTQGAITLADAKLHLRVDTVDEDALITAYIAAATDMAEQYTGRALMPQAWQLSMDAMPCKFLLTRVPVQSVASIVYTDATGIDRTLDPATYVLQNSSDFAHACVHPAYATTWPTSRAQPDAVRLLFVSGYASQATVPDGIQQWIKLMVGAMYARREAVDEAQTYSLGFADRLLDRYIVWGL